MYILGRRGVHRRQIFVGKLLCASSVESGTSVSSVTSETVSVLFLPGSKFVIRCRDSLKKIKVVRRFRDVHFSLHSQLKFLFDLGSCREATQTAFCTQVIVCYKMLHVINVALCLKAHVISSSRIEYRGMLY